MEHAELTPEQIELASIMKQARINKKIRQIDIAPEIGLNNATLSKYESGKLPFPDSVLIKLANIYDLDYYTLPGVEKPRLIRY